MSTKFCVPSKHGCCTQAPLFEGVVKCSPMELEIDVSIFWECSSDFWDTVRSSMEHSWTLLGCSGCKLLARRLFSRSLATHFNLRERVYVCVMDSEAYQETQDLLLMMTWRTAPHRWLGVLAPATHAAFVCVRAAHLSVFVRARRGFARSGLPICSPRS